MGEVEEGSVMDSKSNNHLEDYCPSHIAASRAGWCPVGRFDVRLRQILSARKPRQASTFSHRPV